MHERALHGVPHLDELAEPEFRAVVLSVVDQAPGAADDGLIAGAHDPVGQGANLRLAEVSEEAGDEASGLGCGAGGARDGRDAEGFHGVADLFKGEGVDHGKDREERAAAGFEAGGRLASVEEEIEGAILEGRHSVDDILDASVQLLADQVDQCPDYHVGGSGVDSALGDHLRAVSSCS